MFPYEQCTGCGELFRTNELFLVDGGENIYCSTCNDEYEEDFEVIEVKINE